MQDCRVKIVHMYRISDDIVAVIVGLTGDNTILPAPASRTVKQRMMVTSVIRGGGLPG